MRVLVCIAALLVSSDAARLASSVDSGTPEGTATQSAATAAELATAGEEADTIVPRWHGAVSALQEVQSASASAQTWHGELDEEVTAIQTILANTDNGLAAALDGTATYDEIRAIHDGAHLLSVADNLLDATSQAARLSALLGQLANTMVSATGLADMIGEISGVWARVDLDLVRGLEQRAQALEMTFSGASGAVTSGDEILHEQFNDWDELGSWTQSRRVYSYQSEMRGGLEQVGQARTVIDPAFDQLRQLVVDTVQTAGALVDACHEVGHFRDRGVGASEEIQRIFCSDRSVRRFVLDADIDLRSMTCQQNLYSLAGYQQCRCASESDCYVTSEYRPVPQSKKRCFRPV